MPVRFAWLRWVLPALFLVAGAACTSSGTTCPAGQIACGGQCVDPASDPLHCGGCNTACFAGAPCTNGVCACPAGTSPCGVQCVDLQTDASNCGACGHACGLGTCDAGSCACNPPPVALCTPPAAGTCVDTSSNASNCGRCGNVCLAGEVCASSTCACDPPRQICAEGATSVCADLQTNPKHCGSCTTACAAGETCAAGTCQRTCAVGYTLCGDTCVNLQTDPAHCGSCTNACLLGQSCSAGTCQSATCTTLTCTGTCCEAPAAGNACCTGACPFRHRNFIGTPSEMSYFDCNRPFVWTVETAENAARAWAPGGIRITPTQSCPLAGGSLCLVWQRPIGALQIGCAVFCYSGPFAGAATVTSDFTCPCPTTQQIDWY
ncbi:MAG TPA: hypothetical protein VFM53_03180 [Anaeromyxobacteraceae bacterium]|nr:hypothetical protein [Anaeromyxobacteraceae bacterium]